MTVLVATSGDTGPAAAHSVANRQNVDLVLLYPLNRVSKVQELQMLTMDAPNIHVVAGKFFRFFRNFDSSRKILQGFLLCWALPL